MSCKAECLNEGAVRAGKRLLRGATSACFLIFFSSVLECAAPAAGVLRPAPVVRARRTASPVEIDGRLDEKDWLVAARTTGFFRRTRRADGWSPFIEPAEARSCVRILYDDKYVYIGMELEEPEMDRLSSEASERDSSAIWSDDIVELFIFPGGVLEHKEYMNVTIAGADYFHLAVNADGVFRDSIRRTGMPPQGDTGYDTGLVAAGSRKEDRWTLEMKLPAESLGGRIEDGDVWLMNVGRARPGREWSSWGDGSSHDPGAFRRVVFGECVLENGNFSALEPAARWQRERGVAGDSWISRWDPDAKKVEVLKGLGNVVRLENGQIRTCLNIASNYLPGPGKILPAVAARGEGRLEAGVEITGPAGKRRMSGVVELSKAPRLYSFDFRVERGEHGYLYIATDGEAFIEHASAVVKSETGAGEL